jgi:ribonucleoside-diphosphate reductase alpha chain
MRFEPSGMTDDPDIRLASSILDYIFRRLALDFLPFDTRSAMGIHTAGERTRHLETGSYLPAGDDDVDVEGLAQSAPRSELSAGKGAPSTELTGHSAGSAKRSGSTGSMSTTELIEAQQGRTADAPLCLSCGTKMRPAGSCYVCEGCGSTSGCS